MALELTEAADAFLAAARTLVDADVEKVSPSDLIDSYAAIETATRMVPTVGHAILNRLDREVAPTELGATSWWKVLAQRCRISKGDAQKRIAWARLLGSRRAMNGEALAPHLEYTAAVQAEGLIGDDHVQVIKSFFAELPESVDLPTRIQCERTLAGLATQLEPSQLGKAAKHLLAHVHPDGTLTDGDRQRRRGLTLGKQQADGMSRLAGWVTPEWRALFEPLLAKFGPIDPRDPNPPAELPADGAPNSEAADDEPGVDVGSSDEAVDDEPGADPFAGPAPAMPGPPTPPFLDQHWRTLAQRNHDALMMVARMMLRTKNLGQLNGLPVSVVVTTTLQELEKGAGYAVTAGGSHLPISDLIRMAAQAFHYLAVFDKHTAQALYLGRTQRCATGAQKLVLFARDRGCTCPGCDAAGYATQAHHGVADWKNDGQTNVDDMTLACGPDNLMVETTEWTTRRRDDGVFEWIPPPHLDTGQSRINYTHHPERLLAPEDDPP
jgi:hypothetical protein